MNVNVYDEKALFYEKKKKNDTCLKGHMKYPEQKLVNHQLALAEWD